MKPSAEQQLQFLQNLQRLFEEGDFVATYKYALLMALAELSVESEQVDEKLELSMAAIAEKFVELYWPQTAPYTSGAHDSVAGVLCQNQGKQTAVINALMMLRDGGVSTITQAKKSLSWSAVIKTISRTVVAMPVQYLQNVGGALVPFLYQYPNPTGKIVLNSGVAEMLRTFHQLIQQLSRAGWVKHIRENKQNAEIVGQVDELETFMFGSSRTSLSQAVEYLRKLQSGKCFYCTETLKQAVDVDHFIPWSKYPRDLAHNFVLAHASCNRKKSDMLAAQQHLHNWLDRNQKYGLEIAGELSGLIADNDCSNRVALWAYEHGIVAGSHGWVGDRHTEPLTQACISLFAEVRRSTQKYAPSLVPPIKSARQTNAL